MSLILFPESIANMLSLIYDSNHTSNNMIITMCCFFPFWDNNTHRNVSITVFIIFALSSIDKYFLQIFLSRYCSILIIVLVIHKYGIIWYRILRWIGISMIWNKTHVPVYSHFVVVAAIHSISLFVPDIDFDFIFIFILSINDIDVHLHNQFHCCCYSYLSCCLLEMDR